MEQRETAKSIISKAIAHTSNYSELITWGFIVNVLSESAKYSHHILGWEGDIVNRKIELTSGTKPQKERACGSALNALSSATLEEVAEERKRQEEKWGEQDHDPSKWLMILGEEVGEANKAALEARFTGYERTGDLSDYREALIQVAAVAVAMVECLDRDKWRQGG